MSRLLAAFTDRLIVRSLRGFFRAVYVQERQPPPAVGGAVLFANHSYWWDGYLLHVLARHWRPRRLTVWMRELDRFPPFRLLGAQPFPADSASARAATVRRTLRALRETDTTLAIFPEGDIPPRAEVGVFQPGLHWLHRRLPAVPLLPAALHIALGPHQYPEGYVLVGEPFECALPQHEWLGAAREKVLALREELRTVSRPDPERFTCLLAGRLSVDERRCSGNRPRGPRPVAERD